MSHVSLNPNKVSPSTQIQQVPNSTMVSSAISSLTHLWSDDQNSFRRYPLSVRWVVVNSQTQVSGRKHLSESLCIPHVPRTHSSICFPSLAPITCLFRKSLRRSGDTRCNHFSRCVPFRYCPEQMYYILSVQSSCH